MAQTEVQQQNESKPTAHRAFSGFISCRDENGCLTDTSFLLDGLAHYATTLNCRYFLILHDKDVLEDGKPTLEHIHFVFHRTEGRHLDMGLVKGLSSFLHIAQNRVTLSYCRNYIGAIRYLVHEDDLDKFQYSPLSVLTNDKPTLDLSIHGEVVVTLDLLLDLASQSTSKIFFMKRLGLENYMSWRNVIKDLLEDYTAYVLQVNSCDLKCKGKK